MSKKIVNSIKAARTWTNGLPWHPNQTRSILSKSDALCMDALYVPKYQFDALVGGECGGKAHPICWYSKQPIFDGVSPKDMYTLEIALGLALYAVLITIFSMLGFYACSMRGQNEQSVKSITQYDDAPVRSMRLLQFLPSLETIKEVSQEISANTAS